MMPRRHNSYPISNLIAAVLERSGLRPSLFVQRLGYKSIAGGLKNLDRFLLEGKGPTQFLDGVAKVFDIPPERLSSALNETESVLKLEADINRLACEVRRRKNFQPYVWIETEDERPSSVSMAAICNFKMKVIALPPETVSETDSEQIESVRRHIMKHESFSSGQCPLYGRITGYRVIKSFDESIRLDLSGNVIEAISGPFNRPVGFASLK